MRGNEIRGENHSRMDLCKIVCRPPSEARFSGFLRHSPIDAFQQTTQLRPRDRDHSAAVDGHRNRPCSSRLANGYTP
jgi:hypothetical protein